MVEQAVEQVLASGAQRGKLSDLGLRFLVETNKDGETQIAFSDLSWERASLWRLVLNSLLIGAGALVVFFIISLFLSRLALKPVEEAWTQQRQFVADASHELKTPLQGIIGSAELLETGMVKPEDVPRFVGHIRKEASRLVNLIEDIIRLSQLDEGVELPAEQVDMLALAEDVKEFLAPSAAEKNVKIHVAGNGFTIKGVRRMLQEIIYNLCDNAIKYNVPGGSVTIHAENNRLVVSDTGIGIPAEHKDRIFERFYRVDKSHSKASGGTGLGLSIVKHAVAYHNAGISLESTPGKGTTITIQF